MKFADAINSKYNDLVYANYAHCSNLASIESGTFVSPFPRKNYVILNCSPKANGYPDIVPVGYYKVVVNIRAEVDVSMVFIIKVKSRM